MWMSLLRVNAGRRCHERRKNRMSSMRGVKENYILVMLCKALMPSVGVLLPQQICKCSMRQCN